MKRTFTDTMAKIAEATSDLIAGIAPDETISYLNPAFETITGWTIKEWLGHPMKELIHPEDWDAVLRHFKSTLCGVRAANIEVRVRCKSGCYSTLEFSCVPNKLDDGQVVGTLGIGRDITERKKAFKAQEERLSLALEAANLGFFGWNFQTGRVDWSETLQRMFGFGPGEWEGTFDCFLGRIHPDDRERTRRQIELCRAGACEYDNEYRIVWPNGSPHWIHAKGRVQADSSGKPVGMLGVAFDVTDRKSTQESLLRAADDLARSNRELEEFAYIVSHDLKEPLRMISSYLSLISRKLKGSTDPDFDEYIRYALEGADRMKELIEDLLDYSRVGRSGRRFDEFSAESSLALALRQLGVAIEEAQAEVTHEPLPDVYGDPTQLAQVFQNLISNSLKYRASARPKIHISSTEENGWCVFSVSDNGIGLDMQYAERIFKIFQRLHPKHEYSGTGIGLAVCKKIVERHGGQIWVESVPGQGSDFRFRFPKHAESILWSNTAAARDLPDKEAS